MATWGLLLAPIGAALLSPALEAATSGVCRFDTATLNFAGPRETAAKCLLRPVRIAGNLGPALDQLPNNLSRLIGGAAILPRDKLRAHLKNLKLSETRIGGNLDLPLSKNGAGIGARFFVIHDTSSPNFGAASAFPGDIDTSTRVNALPAAAGSNSPAHLFINRKGETLTNRSFDIGSRATRLESRVVGTPARGLFIHVELIQPRRSKPSGPAGNDQLAPDPGFTDAQYERLALAYAVASTRAGKWLLPAFHAVLDDGIPGGHDDPQNFDLAKFDTTLGRVIEKIDATTP